MQEENFDLGEELQKNDAISEVLAIIDLDAITYEQERNRISEQHGVSKGAIDRFIKELKKREKTGGTTEIVAEVEPSEKSISGDKLLSAIKETLLKYIILPSGVAEPISAWVILTYCCDAFRILPMLGIISPVKRCGKTTLLEILQGMTNKALMASNITPAAIYRTIEKYSPTLLVDEADTFLKDNDELRGVVNSGHTRKGAHVIRTQGDDHDPVKFSTWGPKAIAMIGSLPDTLKDRSVVVSLRRKAPGEAVSKIGIDYEQESDEIRRACRRWADDNMDALKGITPDIPQTNNDRMTYNWTPLIAIADVAGDTWPVMMRKAMLGMLDGTDDSIGPKLLNDIQEIFISQSAERIFSDDLVDALTDIKDSPWCDWNRSKGLTQNGLARLLKPFNIFSKSMRIEGKLKKGYDLDSFEDAFKRYIPLIPPISTVTTEQNNNINDIDQKQNVTVNNGVTDEKQLKLLESIGCYAVTDETGGIEEDTDIPEHLQGRIDPELAKKIYG